MEQTKVTAFLQKNKHLLFEKDMVDQEIIEGMLKLKDEYLPILERISLRDPAKFQLIALVPGIIGIDCFYLGNIVRGILKYFTFGGIGILWIKDVISAKKRCREYNRKRLLKAINDPNAAKAMIINQAKSKVLTKGAVDIGKTLAKGAKDIQKGLEVH